MKEQLKFHVQNLFCDPVYERILTIQVNDETLHISTTLGVADRVELARKMRDCAEQLMDGLDKLDE